MLALLDRQFENVEYRLSEAPHRYGKNIHILSDPFLLTQLGRLCAETTTQPWINELVTQIYTSLLHQVVNREFPKERAPLRTRMAEFHPEAVFESPRVAQTSRVVTVNLARAGTLPSHTCYQALNTLIEPASVRQDHISIARITDSNEQVTGSQVSGHKIGGPVDQSLVLIPDPMGATGNTIVETLNLYKSLPGGRAKKYIALHCIVTPEYLAKVTQAHPDLVVYAVRLDRGLSPKEVLLTVPGTRWKDERGLNHQQYIVPGGGGFGEIMNNAYA